MYVGTLECSLTRSFGNSTDDFIYGDRCGLIYAPTPQRLWRRHYRKIPIGPYKIIVPSQSKGFLVIVHDIEKKTIL